MQRLLLLGLNHTTAPLEVRERLAFNAGQRDAAVAALRERFPACEAVLLSTCNRVEPTSARGQAFPAGTGMAEGVLSVASVAVDYARQIFEHFGDKTVLCIGAGTMTTLALQHFAGLAPGKLLVCNRDPAKAQKLAETFRG